MKNILKEYREQGRWTQKEFAAHVGISVPHLSLIENGKRTPSLGIAMDIAEVFCVQIEDIWSK